MLSLSQFTVSLGKSHCVYLNTSVRVVSGFPMCLQVRPKRNQGESPAELVCALEERAFHTCEVDSDQKVLVLCNQ